MTPTQKYAWFNVLVIALAVVTVLTLVPILGVARAHGGFGFLGLLGFGPLFYRKRRGDVMIDERDELIRQRSVVIGHVVFWVVFVLACTSLPLRYGSKGCLPVIVAQMSVWWALCLVVGLSSVATLVQYQRGGADAS